jgi:nitroreductase
MEFAEVVRRRRMVRRYADRPVDPAVVDRMLEHATHAPSAGFSQGWAFLRLDTRADVDRFWRSTTEPPADGPDQPAPNRWLDGMRTAPVVIVAWSDRTAYLDRYAEPDKGWTDREPTDVEARWPVPYWHVDTGMAALLILQTAVDEGLGACFFGVPAGRVDALRREFGVPARFTPVGAITVGHRTDSTGSPGSPARRARRPVAEVVHHGRWGAPPPG